MVAINAETRAAVAHRAGQKCGRASNPAPYILARYRDTLASVPPPNAGQSHTWLLSTANRARLAGLSADEAARDISEAIPRKPARDIREAVRKAFNVPCGDFAPRPYAPRPVRKKVDCARFWRGIPAHGDPLAELARKSPVYIGADPERHAAYLLAHLYQPLEFVYVGTGREYPEAQRGCVLTAREWIRRFQARGIYPPHFVINPLSGQPGKTKSDTLSYRADSCVLAWRYALIEFDGISLSRQGEFWLASRLPVAALIHSGSKSIHALLRVDCADAAEWESRIENKLIPALAELGADGACKNEARLSRLPGVRRGESWQRLLYLDHRAEGIR